MNETTELKVMIKTCASQSKHYRLEEQKSLTSARTFREFAAKEIEEDLEDAVKDIAKSEGFYNLYQNLRHQRTHLLRKRARHLQIAYGFLRGRDYIQLELSSYTKPDWDEVEKFVFAYLDDSGENDPRIIKQNLERWIQEGLAVEDTEERHEEAS